MQAEFAFTMNRSISFNVSLHFACLRTSIIYIYFVPIYSRLPAPQLRYNIDLPGNTEKWERYMGAENAGCTKNVFIFKQKETHI
jgi:hypothetical protein